MEAAPARLFLDDYPAYRDTLGRLHAFAATRPETVVVPSHCAASIGEARLALA